MIFPSRNQLIRDLSLTRSNGTTVLEKLRHAADVPGSIARFRFYRRTAQ